MSLSYYSNCPASDDPLDSTNVDPPITFDHLLTATPDNSFDHHFYNPHQLFDPNDLFYSSSENPNPFPNPDTSFDFSKLQKHYPDECFIDSADPVFFDNALFPNPSYNIIYNYSPVGPETTLPEFPTGPPDYNNGPKETTGGGLSAQSIAARQRRRKITEKTRELGKLVPGGQKMNTAEMLQAAYKYIKFLQAQVGILEFVGSYGGTSYSDDRHDMHDLLVSEMIQEKLYSNEKCLVPNKFVEEISVDDRMVRDNPQLVSIVKRENLID